MTRQSINPDRHLELLRAALERHTAQTDNLLGDSEESAAAVVELVTELDDHIRAGGDLPAGWQHPGSKYLQPRRIHVEWKEEIACSATFVVPDDFDADDEDAVLELILQDAGDHCDAVIDRDITDVSEEGR